MNGLKNIRKYAAALKMPKKVTMRLFFVPPVQPSFSAQCVLCLQKIGYKLLSVKGNPFFSSPKNIIGPFFFSFLKRFWF